MTTNVDYDKPIFVPIVIQIMDTFSCSTFKYGISKFKKNPQEVPEYVEMQHITFI